MRAWCLIAPVEAPRTYARRIPQRGLKNRSRLAAVFFLFLAARRTLMDFSFAFGDSAAVDNSRRYGLDRPFGPPYLLWVNSEVIL